MNQKHLYKIRLTIAGVVFTLAIAGFLGTFYPIKIFNIQILPVLQRVITDFSITAVILLIILSVITFLCGRIYCSVICPFGILQEIIGFIKTKIHKVKNQKRLGNFPLKYFIAAIVWGIFIGGSSLVIRYIDPYSLFGSALTLSAVGIAALIIVLIVIMFSDRIFCTNFCPVGTLLGIISKFSLFKIYITNDCVSCGNCEKICPSGCINSKDKKLIMKSA